MRRDLGIPQEANALVQFNVNSSWRIETFHLPALRMLA